MKKYIILILIVCAGGCTTVPESLVDDHLTAGAYKQILNETVWIDGAFYGFSGDIENRTATATRLLLARDNARDFFLRLLDDAEPAGKLYALCGLYYADRDQFKKEIEAFRLDTREIQSTSADTSGPERICDIVFCPYDDGETKRITLKRGQSLQQWFRDHNGETGYGDISGGADPERIVNPTFGEE